MKAKWICGWIAMLLIFCQPVSAKNESVLDETLYYGEAMFYQANDNGYLPITTIEPGEILCSYSVISGKTADVAMIAGLYHRGVLVDTKIVDKTITAHGSALYAASITVPQTKDYEIRLFLVRDLSVTAPMKKLAALSEKSNAKDVTAFSLCGSAGRINQSGNSITVMVPPHSDLSLAVPEITVSPGASYALHGTDFSQTVWMTVTAEDQSERQYRIETVYANREDAYDFEDYEVGAGAEKKDSNHWVGPAAQNPDIVEMIAQAEDNRVLQLSDNSLSARADVRSTNWEMTAPFTLSTRICYCLPDGVTERNKEDDYSYCTFFATNDNPIDLNKTDFYFNAFEPVWSNDAFYFHYYKEGKRVKSNLKIIPSAWYEVTMQYYQAKDGLYYTDYSIVNEDGVTTEFSKIPSGRTETKLTGLYLVTSPGRRATILLDNIRVTEDTAYGCEEYTQDFAEAAPEGWNGGTVATMDGRRVFCISDGQATASIPGFLGSTELSFDLSLNDPSGNGVLFAFGTETETFGTLAYQNGILGYETEEQIVAFDDQLGRIHANEVCHISMEYVVDAAYENCRIDYYSNGIKIGSAAAENASEYFDHMCYTAPSGGMNISNVHIVKR